MAVKSVSIRIEEILQKIGFVADEEEHGSIEGEIEPSVNVKPARKY